jgi:hypothetical protein
MQSILDKARILYVQRLVQAKLASKVLHILLGGVYRRQSPRGIARKIH